LFNGFTEKLKQSRYLCIRSELLKVETVSLLMHTFGCMQWSNRECRP